MKQLHTSHMVHIDAVVNDYGVNRRRLSNAEERILIEHAQRSNKKAMDLLVRHNMLFCIKVANQYTSKLSQRDLYQAAAIGLIKAIRCMDNTRGLRLISYAVWWIKSMVTKEINETSDIVRLPNQYHVKMSKINADRKTDQEYEDWYWAVRDTVSLDKKITDDSSTTLSNFATFAEPSDFEAELTDRDYCEKQIQKVMSLMSEHEREITKMLFSESGRYLSERDVATAKGISSQRVQQIKRNGFAKVRANIQTRRDLERVCK